MPVPGETRVTKRRSRAPRCVVQRSAVTNGTDLLPGVDHRSTWVRRVRDLQALHLVDIGGENMASEAQLSIIRRAAVLTVQLEQLEQMFALGGLAGMRDLDAYQRGSNTLRRLLQTIGIKRQARDVTPPTVEAYIAHANRQAAAA